MNRSWGGNLEIAAISELYNLGVVVWELSREGRLVTPFDNIALTVRAVSMFVTRQPFPPINPLFLLVAYLAPSFPYLVALF